MVFSSKIFLFLFFPLLYVIYFMELKKGKELSVKIKNVVLFVASLLFYAYGEPKFIFVLFAAIVFNWLAVIWMDAAKEQASRKRRMFVCVIADLMVLFVFKYLTFLCDNVFWLFGRDNTLINITLPLGISFFVFQILSYVFDVYRFKAEANGNFLEVGLYICLFPQLIAGPIVRYTDIICEIKQRTGKKEDITEGFYRFVIGLSKKVLLADYLASLADTIFDGFWNTNVSSVVLWVGAVAYTMQIYLDFSGYSDMAIGLGRIFGFHFDENFNYPYISKSVTEFWHRWHISLSSWFRDYVYIPLGGNKEGKAKLFRNLCIVWILTGIWHGAEWTFLLWGIWYLIWLLLEKFVLSKTKWEKIHVVNHIYTMFIVMIGWVIFRCNNIAEAVLYLKTMFSRTSLEATNNFMLEAIKSYTIILPVCAICCIPIGDIIRVDKISGNLKAVLKSAGLIILFAISCLAVIKQEYSPFIYFNF